MARRLARGRFRRTRGALGVRSYQAMNVMGLRVWADKPRQFGGKKWRANCATVQRSIDRARGRVFSPRRGLYAPDWRCRMCFTGGLNYGQVGGLDAPEYLAQGCMLSGFYSWRQGYVIRADEFYGVPF